jgi:hypothetical protein
MKATYWITGYPVFIDAKVHSAERIQFVITWRVLMGWVEIVPNARN